MDISVKKSHFLNSAKRTSLSYDDGRNLRCCMEYNPVAKYNGITSRYHTVAS